MTNVLTVTHISASCYSEWAKIFLLTETKFPIEAVGAPAVSNK